VRFDAEVIVDLAVAALMAALGYPTDGAARDGELARVLEREST
jgi:hypothetical protein